MRQGVVHLLLDRVEGLLLRLGSLESLLLGYQGVLLGGRRPMNASGSRGSDKQPGSEPHLDCTRPGVVEGRPLHLRRLGGSSRCVPARPTAASWGLGARGAFVSFLPCLPWPPLP